MMQRVLRLCVLLIVGVTSSACLYPPREEVLDGLPCDTDGQCAAGYFCNVGICLLDGTPLDAGAPPDAGFDAGPPVDAGPSDGGSIVPPSQISGAVAGAERMQSSSFRLDLRVGSAPLSGSAQSTSYRMKWGSK